MKELLIANGMTHIAWVSIGVYWNRYTRCWNVRNFKVWIVFARHIKSVHGYKTDKKDSESVQVRNYSACVGFIEDFKNTCLK